MNPVVSMGSTQFRDPQVIRYVEGKNKWWVMSVAKSHQYRIQFYKSNNLKNWKRTSYFELYGLLGYQYECPNLAKIQYEGTQQAWKEKADENNGYLWVLFISINPGSLQGGSSTEYFIGTFDGLKFTPIKNYAAPIDYGKDFYALQVFFTSPKDDNDQDQVHAIAWTSNWQYCATVPTDNWRSSMSLVRKLQLADFQSAPGTYIPFIKSTPVIDPDKIRYGSSGSFNSEGEGITFDIFHPKHTIDISDELNGAIEFTLTWTVKDKQWTKNNPANFYLDFRGYAIPDEYLRLGFQAEASAFFIDRGNTNVEWVHTNRFFTDKISVNVQPNPKEETQEDSGNEGDSPGTTDSDSDSESESNISSYSVRGIIDRNIVELYFGNGFQVLTNTFFMTGGNFIGSIDISIDSIAYDYTKNKYMNPFTIKLDAKQI
jgi:beta-fructofuranosidase